MPTKLRAVFMTAYAMRSIMAKHVSPQLTMAHWKLYFLFYWCEDPSSTLNSRTAPTYYTILSQDHMIIIISSRAPRTFGEFLFRLDVGQYCAALRSISGAVDVSDKEDSERRIGFEVIKAIASLCKHFSELEESIDLCFIPSFRLKVPI